MCLKQVNLTLPAGHGGGGRRFGEVLLQGQRTRNVTGQLSSELLVLNVPVPRRGTRLISVGLTDDISQSSVRLCMQRQQQILKCQMQVRLLRYPCHFLSLCYVRSTPRVKMQIKNTC